MYHLAFYDKERLWARGDHLTVFFVATACNVQETGLFWLCGAQMQLCGPAFLSICGAMTPTTSTCKCTMIANDH